MRTEFQFREIVVVLALLIVWTLCSAILGCNFWLYIALSFYIVIMGYYCQNFKENIFLIFFLLSFFTFLMSGQVAHDMFGYKMTYVNSDEDFSFLNFTILISLMSLVLGYYFGGIFTITRNNNRSHYDAAKEWNYRKISKVLFYICVIPWFILLIEQVVIVRTLSYADYYTFTSRLPGILDQISNACPLVFCFFLGTFPTKKEAELPMLIVEIYAIISILTGRRIYFVTYSLLILAYLLIRNQDDNETWITKKQITIILIILPALIVFLFSYRYIRYGLEVKSDSLFDSFIGFFAQQGYSANLIVVAKNYEDIIPDHIYSFTQTIRFLRMNLFTRHVLGLNYSYLYTKNSTFSALNSGSFASFMSYLLMPGGYSRGLGTGTCYIAELYSDGGVIGVFAGNFIYGLAIKRIVSIKKNFFIRNAIALFMFWTFLISPRYNFDRPFASFLSYSFILTFLILYSVNNIMISKK